MMQRGRFVRGVGKVCLGAEWESVKVPCPAIMVKNEEDELRLKVLFVFPQAEKRGYKRKENHVKIYGSCMCLVLDGGLRAFDVVQRAPLHKVAPKIKE